MSVRPLVKQRLERGLDGFCAISPPPFPPNTFVQVYRYSFVVVCILAVGGGIAYGVSDDGRGFAGFTIAWAVFFVIAALYAVSFALKHRGELNAPLYGSAIFPVYVYVPANNSVEQVNGPTVAAFVAFFFAVLWGLGASIFVRPAWIGLLVAGGASALFFITAMNLLQTPAFVFGRKLQVCVYVCVCARVRVRVLCVWVFVCGGGCPPTPDGNADVLVVVIFFLL